MTKPKETPRAPQRGDEPDPDALRRAHEDAEKQKPAAKPTKATKE